MIGSGDLSRGNLGLDLAQQRLKRRLHVDGDLRDGVILDGIEGRQNGRGHQLQSDEKRREPCAGSAPQLYGSCEGLPPRQVHIRSHSHRTSWRRHG